MSVSANGWKSDLVGEFDWTAVMGTDRCRGGRIASSGGDLLQPQDDVSLRVWVAHPWVRDLDLGAAFRRDWYALR